MNRREISRSTVAAGESGGYAVIVYQETYDAWDDPERRVTERVALVGGSRGIPTREEVEAPGGGSIMGWTDIIGGTVYDGPDGMGTDRKMMAAAAARREVEKAERKARRSKITSETPTVTKARCPECEEFADEDEYDEPVYECSRCGSQGRGDEGRRCDQGCGIFRAKLAERSCPYCEEPVEGTLELVEGYEIDGVFEALPPVPAS